MTNIQVKDVPADVHRILSRRAAAAHQSLQQYLVAQLTEAARQPTLEEVLARGSRRPAPDLVAGAAADLLADERAGR